MAVQSPPDGRGGVSVGWNESTAEREEEEDEEEDAEAGCYECELQTIESEQWTVSCHRRCQCAPVSLRPPQNLPG